MAESSCEAPGCSFPGTICPACGQCFCSQHLRSSSCETCHNLLAHRSIEYRLSRLAGGGLALMLCGLLFLFLPHDAGGMTISLAILLMIVGFVLVWLGLLARP